MILHNLEEILDVYPTELGRIKSEMPTITSLDKICKEKNIDPARALCFRIALNEWVVVAKETESEYKSNPILK